jgi:hypothetical protein
VVVPVLAVVPAFWQTSILLEAVLDPGVAFAHVAAGELAVAVVSAVAGVHSFPSVLGVMSTLRTATFMFLLLLVFLFF